MNCSSAFHDLFEALDLNLFSPLIGALLSIDPIEDSFFCEDVEDGADGLEHDRRVCLEQVREAPRSERVVAPDEQVGALVDLGDGHGAAALDIDVVNAQTEVVDNSILILGLVEVRADRLRLEQTTEQDWIVRLFELLVIAKLSLPVVTPDKQSFFGGDTARVDDTG